MNAKQRFLDSVWRGFKAASLGAALTASVIFWAIGLDTSIDLLAGSTPVVCKNGGQQ